MKESDWQGWQGEDGAEQGTEEFAGVTHRVEVVDLGALRAALAELGVDVADDWRNAWTWTTGGRKRSAQWLSRIDPGKSIRGLGICLQRSTESMDDVRRGDALVALGAELVELREAEKRARMEES